MELSVIEDPAQVAELCARQIAVEARRSALDRGRFLLAVSGGRSPWAMLKCLSRQDLPWRQVHVFQVDERVAPSAHPDRNLIQLRDALLEKTELPEDHIHPMPVEANDLQKAAKGYGALLREVAGTPPTLDVVHLGLGTDGHTASLTPEDPVLNVMEDDVGITRPYQGRQRMTLTYPILNRSRHIFWLVAGMDKAGMLARLIAGDLSIPAGRIRRDNAMVFADSAAARRVQMPGEKAPLRRNPREGGGPVLGSLGEGGP